MNSSPCIYSVIYAGGLRKYDGNHKHAAGVEQMFYYTFILNSTIEYLNIICKCLFRINIFNPCITRHSISTLKNQTAMRLKSNFEVYIYILLGYIFFI